MQFVQPIKDLSKIKQIKDLLRGGGLIRDLLLFELGINSALRISDFLSLKIKDVLDENNQPLDCLYINEEKTKKNTQVTITPKAKETIKLYMVKYPGVIENRENYLFFNQRSYPNGNKAITRVMAGMLIDKRCSVFDSNEIIDDILGEKLDDFKPEKRVFL